MGPFENLRPRLTTYIPHEPTPTQRAFLVLPHREAFFGGAAGGGKSDALLMAALQYVDVPGYAALLLRRQLVDAKQPGSIIFRAREWLAPTDAIWRGDESTWYFPSGATLKFGKLLNMADALSYQGTEFQFIGGDELTQLDELCWDYVTGRLRRKRCPIHRREYDPYCRICDMTGYLSIVPLRIRTASNPGGPGHAWVKKRYGIERQPGLVNSAGRPLYQGRIKGRPHIPSFVEDNPFLDQEAYLETLSSLVDPVTREQLLAGNWGITAEGRFKNEWLGYYKQNGSWFDFGSRGTYHANQSQTFVVIDTAASKQSAPGRVSLVPNKQASWTVVSVWTMIRGFLLLRFVARHQKEVPETKKLIRSVLHQFPESQFVGMELTTMSTHLYQIYQHEGFNMRPFSPNTGDKIARSVAATNMMEQGRLLVPDEPSPWLRDWTDEIFTWTGDPKETDDQVDVTSYAAIHATSAAVIGYATRAGDAPSVE